MRKYYFVFLVIIIAACNNNGKDDPSINRDKLTVGTLKNIYDPTKPLVIKVRKDGGKPMTTSALIDNDHRIIKLETGDDFLIGEIKKVIVHNNKVFVFDEKIVEKLFCFDISGKYLFTVGKRGNGPGEMDTPRDFDISNDRIYIIDRKCQVYIFDMNGNYLSTLRLPFLSVNICTFNDSTLFFYNNSYMDEFKFHLAKVNTLDKSVESFAFPFRTSFEEKYGVAQAFSRNGQSALVCKIFCDTLFRLTNNRLTPAYAIDFPNKQPANIFESEKLMEEVSSSSKYWRFFSLSFSETTRHLYFVSSNYNILYHVFNKETLEHKWFKEINDDYFFGGLSNPMPIGVHKDYFVFQLSMPDMMETHKTILEKAKGMPETIALMETKYKDYHELCLKSNKDDNPALLLTKISTKIYEE